MNEPIAGRMREIAMASKAREDRVAMAAQLAATMITYMNVTIKDKTDFERLVGMLDSTLACAGGQDWDHKRFRDDVLAAMPLITADVKDMLKQARGQ